MGEHLRGRDLGRQVSAGHANEVRRDVTMSRGTFHPDSVPREVRKQDGGK